ncbi:hypothetical protein ACS0PU_001925 [Formica fusca]
MVFYFWAYLFFVCDSLLKVFVRCFGFSSVHTKSTDTWDRDTKDCGIPIRRLFRFIREFSTRQYFLRVPIPIGGMVNTVCPGIHPCYLIVSSHSENRTVLYSNLYKQSALTIRKLWNLEII